MADLLTDEQIEDALNHLPEWARDGNALTRTAQLGDFGQAIQVVNRVAEIADSVNHHPDIDIRFRTLTFALSTHSDGGITNNDVSLAEQIDEVIASMR